MQNRVQITSTEQPKAYKAMLGLEGYLAQSSLSKTLKDLIKIRASEINGCAYCIDMHTKEAMANGETLQRIFLISAWREATKFFSGEEQTILAITEEITLIHAHGLSDALYQQALQFFDESQIPEIIMAIVTINAWNRIAISTHLQIED
ncbi:carboxymuconolactone decarboxylase family protein [Niabella yanshanensis]|uniref:Carboxymuconolactone decarboxylase family protein n=1 Tax=Niabella yanshanensis TaxID=577386 RepID=A0ABZ0WAB2_9BACT|nr:carboxymuconolactone decarboxylase family protein [Niabella yanshanensis]WQD38920.1 carboxymuconolactone decarboxylase family protein [Niabella yanshanensis]